MEPWDQAKTEDSKLTMTESIAKPLLLLFFKFLVIYLRYSILFLQIKDKTKFQVGLLILVGALVSHSISILIFVSLYANNTEERTTFEFSRNTTDSSEMPNISETSFDDNMKCLFLMLFPPEMHRFLRKDSIIYQPQISHSQYHGPYHVAK